MSQWNFVIAAYLLVGIAVTALIAMSFAAMRRAEADADAARRR